MTRSRRRAGVVLGLLALVLATLGTVGIGRPAQARPGPSAPVTGASFHRPLAPSHAQAVAALQRAQVMLGDRPAGARTTQGHRRLDLTMALRELRVGYPSLTTVERRQADRLFARPSDADPNDDPYIKYSAPEQTYCRDTLCVHYVLRGVDATNGVSGTSNDSDTIPDYVQTVMRTLHHIESAYTTAGYRAPRRDLSSTDHGPGSQTDIYLAELGPQSDGGTLYGFCTSDDPDAYDQNSTRVAESAYCVLDNDYRHAEYPVHTPLQNLQVTAAHEFFHAVQFAYNYFQDSWIMEATATWAEDELYTGINDNRQYLGDSPLTRPSTPIDVSGFHWYGTWIFFRYLTERQVSATSGGMPVLIRQLWQQLTTYYSVDGLRRALGQHGVGLTTAVSRFDLAARHPGKFFREGSHYPAAPIADSSKVGPGRLAVYARFTLKHLSYEVFQFHPVSGMSSRWRLRLHFDLPDKVRGAAATLWTNYRSGSTAARLIRLDTHGNATISIKFGYRLVKNVEVTLANASTRFGSHCYDAYDQYGNLVASTYYTCFATKSIDDGTTQYVKATAYKS